MNFDLLFSLSNLLVMPFWLLMTLLPHWRTTKQIIKSPWIIIGPVLIYVYLVVPQMSGLFGVLANPSLDGIMAALNTPAATTIAWAHFLAFDLFVGRWIYLDSQNRKISAWFVAPMLFLTLMFGPVGFLGYMVLQKLSGSVTR